MDLKASSAPTCPFDIPLGSPLSLPAFQSTQLPSAQAKLLPSSKAIQVLLISPTPGLIPVLVVVP